MRIELTTLGLWDLRATSCAITAEELFQIFISTVLNSAPYYQVDVYVHVWRHVHVYLRVAYLSHGWVGWAWVGLG